ncbi:SHOCT domain-containing protein [Tropicimonas marinistellae]|uniref:SHOCT domain-containing protein n=1 Tax=Tropicimonas marinistellae TaxID=1739787 RepID=UPI00082F1DEA|nr:SHOCT domain-containing protein [Tropicimonas marinistellae]
MTDITDHGQTTINALAQSHGLSTQAVEQMARAVAQGGGTMAQFNIPELGGSGQWMAGGMTMVGDMFNNGLKYQVETLCNDLTNAMSVAPFFAVPQTIAGSAWWPADLGQPASVGGQNQVRYAYFPQARRIAFDPGTGAPIVLLDTLDHQIGGWGQQQSGPGDPYAGISFSSQYGQFALSSLPKAGDTPTAGPDVGTPVAQPSAPQPTQYVEPAVEAPSGAPNTAGDDPFALLEKLGSLRDAGVLTDEEFNQKKAEILARI